MSKTYAIADLHGMWELWTQIKEFLQPDDKLYVLGDAADRGSSGWAILKEMLADPRVTYIRGNHDQMLLDAWRYDWTGSDYYLWMTNGGYETFEALMQDEKSEIYLMQLARTKLYHCYVNKEGQRIHLSHAGFTLMENDEIPNKEDLLWDRDHCWDHCDFWPTTNPTDYVVHGHTPVRSSTFRNLLYGDATRYKVNNTATVVRYVCGHKICIDSGAFSTRKIALLDLDTLQETVFEI